MNLLICLYCVCIGQYNLQLDPSNEYLVEHAIPAWKMITTILEMDKSKVVKIWAEAMTKTY